LVVNGNAINIRNLTLSAMHITRSRHVFKHNTTSSHVAWAIQKNEPNALRKVREKLVLKYTLKSGCSLALCLLFKMFIYTFCYYLCKLFFKILNEVFFLAVIIIGISVCLFRTIMQKTTKKRKSN